jgi:hypothetical protein
MLRPQDILVSLKFLSPFTAARANYASLAESLGVSASETHAAVHRAIRSGLLIPSPIRPETTLEIRPSVPALSELLCYGVRYFLHAETGRFAVGIPTGASAPPLCALLSASDTPPHIWVHPRGSVRGLAIEPLYPSAPDAALRDPVLAEWLALTDALRLHTGRVAELARNEVRRRFREFIHAAAA